MNKNLLFGFCAALCLALISCEKENDGKYNPQKKIQKIYYDYDGEKELNEVWNWDGKKLSSIDFYSGGEIFSSAFYSYDNKKRIVKIEEGTEILDVVYENDKIKTINKFYDGDLEESFNMIYDNNTLSKIEWVCYDIYKRVHERKLVPLAGLIFQDYDNLEKAMRIIRSQQKGDKADTVLLELTWSDKNVSHIFAYNVDTPEETLDASFTYDNKINPMKGWISIWFDEEIGLWDDSYYTYSSYGNVLTAEYVYKDNGVEDDRYFMNYVYEYKGKYPVKVTFVEDEDYSYTRYYEY